MADPRAPARVQAHIFIQIPAWLFRLIHDSLGWHIKTCLGTGEDVHINYHLFISRAYGELSTVGQRSTSCLLTGGFIILGFLNTGKVVNLNICNIIKIFKLK